ncbi:hypothetical protein KOI35_10960 [Actinoplanes bogorensis]|uniref:Uncharacterized protein n=1 Tax=Paractinoplanes bogorensis TaxID=1610840 RepID=A0ABS5YMN2_9ACTN|nr:hypothetical protein [Actinoplanes bogorensis]MBU2664009.1 hypothetical protein [Actinoplanes bogorensis]
MQLEALRTTWPEEVLTGQYFFQAYGPTTTDDVISFLTDDLIDAGDDVRLRITDAGGRVLMNVLRGRHPGIQAVGVRPAQTWITLLQHVRPPQGEEPFLLRRMRRQLTDRRRHWSSRIRRAAREFTADVHRLRPAPQLVWDVLDNRAGHVIGRLTVPIGVPGARTAIHSATGGPAALLMVEGGLLTVRIGERPVAQFMSAGPAHRVDVAGAVPAGLDPRLVLACALLEYARLSTT